MDQPTQNPQTNPATDTKNKGKNTGMAAIAYILFFVPLLTEAKNDSFVKYHVKQGLVLFICAIIVYYIARIMPYPISSLLELVILVFAIIGIINAVNGVEKPLPVIGSFSDNFKF